MGTAVRTAKTSPASWDAFRKRRMISSNERLAFPSHSAGMDEVISRRWYDIEAFVDAVLAELAAMAATRPTRSGPKPALTGAGWPGIPG